MFILKVQEIGRVDMLIPISQVRKLRPRNIMGGVG